MGTVQSTRYLVTMCEGSRESVVSKSASFKQRHRERTFSFRLMAGTASLHRLKRFLLVNLALKRNGIFPDYTFLYVLMRRGSLHQFLRRKPVCRS
jgi:hypothetical protein